MDIEFGCDRLQCPARSKDYPLMVLCMGMDAVYVPKLLISFANYSSDSDAYQRKL